MNFAQNLGHKALQAARQRQHTQAFKEQHSARAGIEGSISQAVRRTGMRQARYLGFKKTHLQHILTAAALNLSRISRWLLGEPLAQTRRSAFLRLCQPLPSG